MDVVTNLRGVVGLKIEAVQTPEGSANRFSLVVERGQAVPVLCSASRPVFAGETILVSGSRDTDGLVTADTITRLPAPAPIISPPPKLHLLRLILFGILGDILALIGLTLAFPHSSDAGQFFLLLVFGAALAALFAAKLTKDPRIPALRVAVGTSVLILMVPLAIVVIYKIAH